VKVLEQPLTPADQAVATLRFELAAKINSRTLLRHRSDAYAEPDAPLTKIRSQNFRRHSAQHLREAELQVVKGT